MRLFMAAMSLSFAAAGADAQSTITRIAVAGGVATDQRGVRSSALTVAPGLLVEAAPNVMLHLGASATRFARNVFSVGAAGTASAVDPIGSLAALTLTGSGSLTRLQGALPGTFAHADVTPAIEFRLNQLTLFAGARAAIGRTAHESSSPALPVPGGPGTETASRAGAGPVFGGVLALSAGRATLRLNAREERLLIDGDMVPERSAGAEVVIGLTPVASLELSAGRYDANRVLATQAGNYMSAGLSLRFGAATRSSAQAPRVAREGPPGSTRLSLRAPDARRVEVAGDFNEWTPQAATRASGGVWYVDLVIPPGQYRYAFRVNGVEWRVPNGATAVDDGFGGKSAWLTVSDVTPRKVNLKEER